MVVAAVVAAVVEEEEVVAVEEVRHLLFCVPSSIDIANMIRWRWLNVWLNLDESDVLINWDGSNCNVNMTEIWH